MNKQTPILFKPWKVRKILDWDWDNSTMMTRRLLINQSKKLISDGYGVQPIDVLPMPNSRNPNQRSWVTLSKIDSINGNKGLVIGCRYGGPGDLLWVKEARCVEVGATKDEIDCGHFTYKADDTQGLWTKESGYKTLTPLFMPKVFARIWLEIVSVRVERLQDISEEDAKKEGVTPTLVPDGFDQIKYKSLFRDVWDSINKKPLFTWEANPWVWVLEFKKARKP